MKRKCIIAANWKMNLNIEDVTELAQASIEVSVLLKNSCIILFPSPMYTYPLHLSLEQAKKSLLPISIGAQNIYTQEQGAYTGESSASQAKQTGCEYVLIGHSERRHYFNETNEMLRDKINLTLKHNLKPMLCVGETLEQYEQNKAKEVIIEQIQFAFKDISITNPEQIIIAYEPVWAIGTGKTATPEYAENIHQIIREELSRLFGTSISQSVSILYGGSVNNTNIVSLLSQENIDGALIGGASLKTDSFKELVRNIVRTILI